MLFFCLKKTIIIVLIFSNLDLSNAGIKLEQKYEVMAGRDINITCEVDETHPKEQFYWLKDEIVIQSKKTLYLRFSVPDQSGVYTCHYKSPTAYHKASIAVSVIYAPVWMAFKPKKFLGQVSQESQLWCQVSAMPRPTFMWTDPNSRPITNATNTIITNHKLPSESYQGLWVSSLTLTYTSGSDFGTYVCKAENKVDKWSFSIELASDGAPESLKSCETGETGKKYVVILCGVVYKGSFESVNYHVKLSPSSFSASPTERIILPTYTNLSQPFSPVDKVVVSGLKPGQEYIADISLVNQYGSSLLPLNIILRTFPGTEVMKKGETDDSSIVGVIVGVVIAVAIILFVIFFLFYLGARRFKNIFKRLKASSLEKIPAISSHDLLQNRNDKNYDENGVDKNNRSVRFYQKNDQFNMPENGSKRSYINEGFVKNYDIVDGRQYGGQKNLVGQGDVEMFDLFKSIQDNNDGVSKKDKCEIFMSPEDKQNGEYEISRNYISLVTKIHSGEIRDVYQGILSDKKKNIEKKVLVYSQKDNATDDDTELLMNDLEIFKKVIGHQNVVQLIGACTVSHPYVIIAEWIDYCSLFQLLQNSRQTSPLSPTFILSLNLQIVAAMEFVASMQLVHRCLRSSKVMLTSDHVIKLGHFDKARHFQSSTANFKQTHHIRWLPPESIFVQDYSIKANVWSFGVLLWECFSSGSTPYEGMQPQQVVDFVQNGGRLERPHTCLHDLYEIMLSCWVYYPFRRPSFSTIQKQLDNILKNKNNNSNKKNNNINNNKNNNKDNEGINKNKYWKEEDNNICNYTNEKNKTNNKNKKLEDESETFQKSDESDFEKKKKNKRKNSRESKKKSPDSSAKHRNTNTHTKKDTDSYTNTNSFDSNFELYHTNIQRIPQINTHTDPNTQTPTQTNPHTKAKTNTHTNTQRVGRRESYRMMREQDDMAKESFI